jgi:hypothetical protein
MNMFSTHELNPEQNFLVALCTRWHTSPSMSRKWGAFSQRVHCFVHENVLHAQLHSLVKVSCSCDRICSQQFTTLIPGHSVNVLVIKCFALLCSKHFEQIWPPEISCNVMKKVQGPSCLIIANRFRSILWKKAGLPLTF